MMRLWTFTAREIKSRPGRAGLTLASIVIAVAAVVSVNLAATTTRRAYKDMYESLAGRAALEVVAEGGGPFEESTVDVLEKTPGVKAVAPLFQQPTVLRHGNRWLNVMVMGIDPIRDKAVRDYPLKEGRYFDGNGALLEAEFAAGLDIKLGQEVRLLTRRGGTGVPVVGLLAPRGAINFNQGAIVFLPLPVVQRLFRRPHEINTASLVLNDSADPAQVLATLARHLPAGIRAQTPAARTQLASETLQSTEQGLNFAYGLILMLAIFMILNTFLMNVSERRRQLAILRAIGATRGQITGMLLGEGLIMGVVGALVGATVGLGGACLLMKAMSHLFTAPLPAIHFAATPFLAAVAVGPGIALLGTFIPARMAGKISPLEGMRPVVAEAGRRVSPWFALVGLTLYLITAVVLAACVLGWLPIVFSVPAGIAVTVTFVLLFPPVLAPLVRAIALSLSPILRAEGGVAQRQVLRRRARTTLTVGVLYLAVSTGIGLGTAITDNVEDVRTWFRRTTVGDFFLSATTPDPETGMTARMPEELGGEVGKIPGVASVHRVRFVSARAGDQPVVVIVSDFAAQEQLPLDLRDSDPAAVRRQLLAGEVVVGSALAQRAGLAAGKEIVLETKSGSRRFRVAATTNSYTVGGLVVCMEWAVGQRLLGAEQVDAFAVKAAPGALAKVEAGLRAMARQRDFTVYSYAELSRMQEAIMSGVVGSLWGLLALAFIVAAFGIANTLTMNVLEQTREIAILRVLGMSRRQVRKMVLSQAVIMGTMGLLTGLIAGLTTVYVIDLCMLPLIGHAVQMTIRPVLLLGCFATALAIVLLAAWMPAERATRLDLLIALHYE